MKTILVSRFSALGDVTIAVHVLKAVIEQNPEIKIILITKPIFHQLFQNIERISFIKVDLKEKHSGIKGIKQLSKEIIKSYKIDIYIDIHNVLRTKLIKLFLPKNIIKKSINKGRKQKKKISRKHHKIFQQLPHSAQRYANTFINAGINVDLKKYIPNFNYPTSSEFTNFINKFSSKKIAIAPFAAHKTKMYPLEKMQETIQKIPSVYNIFILGGGKFEKEIAMQWESKFKNVYSVIGKFSMTDEIALINLCSLTLTMDSGNMHLASLTNTKIISIWGATHPYFGFTPFKKADTIFIHKELKCRPCSVFGNKKCYRDKMYCLDIHPDEIIKYIN